jgi:hypothetical protein
MGGGIPGSRVVGASDEKAMGPPSGDGIAPDDGAASSYHALGIDCRKEPKLTTGHPIAIVRHGKPIPEFFARRTLRPSDPAPGRGPDPPGTGGRLRPRGRSGRRPPGAPGTHPGCRRRRACSAPSKA